MIKALITLTLVVSAIGVGIGLLRICWNAQPGDWRPISLALSILVGQIAMLTTYFRLPVLITAATPQGRAAFDRFALDHVQMLVGNVYWVLNSAIFMLLFQHGHH